MVELEKSRVREDLIHLHLACSCEPCIHAGLYLRGGRGGIFPLLTAVFPPFRMAVT